MDLNPNSLAAAAAARLSRYAPRTHRANVLEDWRLEPGTYESVAMTHLLHCLPGPMSAKAVAFEHARRALAPGGTFFGVTILGKDVAISPLAEAVIGLSNRRGILDNRGDGPAEFDAALAEVFPERTIRIRGTVALFTARASRHGPDSNFQQARIDGPKTQPIGVVFGPSIGASCRSESEESPACS